MKAALFLFLLFFFGLLQAQSPEKFLEELGKNYPQEKVVLRLSKPAFLAGETIYFKAYVLSGYEPLALSTNLYTELYDSDKKLLDKALVPLLNGSGEGSFTLPASLPEGVYYLRAYTHWMLNFNPSFQTIKPLPVYNPYSAQSLRPAPVQWTARAFVEGGTLLNEQVANVAVRLYASKRLPELWSGQVQEVDSATVVADIMVYNNEIGQVRFIPQAGKRYQLLLRDNGGKEQIVPLPPAAPGGIGLQAAVMGDKLRYALQLKSLPGLGKGYKMVATMSNHPVFSATIAKSDGEVLGSFPINDLPPGVLQLTLFDDKGAPVAERLCFLHQRQLQAVTPAVSFDTLSVAPKGHNRWGLVPDSLSWNSYVAEVLDASVPLQDDFLGDLYLQSDFAAPVQQASWYLTEVTPEKTAALDALLLTETWQRFSWSNVLQNRLPAIRYQPDVYLGFTGTATKGNVPQPGRDLNLLLQAPDSSLSFLQVKTDSAGNFGLQNLLFIDTIRVFYQPQKRKFLEKEVEISFTPQNKFYPYTGTWPAAALTTGPRAKADTLPAALQRVLAQRNNERLIAEMGKLMETVVVKTKARNATEELDRKLSSSLFSGGDATIFDFVNGNPAGAESAGNILLWMQGRVPGFSVIYRDGVPVPQIRNSSVQLFLDEVPVDYDQVNGLSVFDIAMVKVFRGSFVGSVGGGSAIAIYTRRGDMGQRNSVSQLLTNHLVGYKRTAPFTVPDYTKEQNREVSDVRVLLHYGAVLPPDANSGKATLSFYNNDTAKQFRLRITGFTHDGRLVYFDKRIP